MQEQAVNDFLPSNKISITVKMYVTAQLGYMSLLSNKIYEIKENNTVSSTIYFL